jgi:hypothetical protein
MNNPSNNERPIKQPGHHDVHAARVLNGLEVHRQHALLLASNGRRPKRSERQAEVRTDPVTQESSN